MQKILDISFFLTFAAAVNLLGILFAQVGRALHYSMSFNQNILGFIPPLVEKRFGVMSKPYALVSCPICLAGQSALWIGFFLYGTNGDTGAQIFTIPMHLCTIGTAIWWASFFEQKI